MEKYAIIQLDGKQFWVEEGDVFEVNRQKDLDVDVLFYFDGNSIYVGEPELEDVEVDAEIVEDKKAKKIEVIRFKNKSHYRRKRGHRQPISVVKINSIKKSRKSVKKESK